MLNKITKIQKRFLLFLVGCIGTRSLMVYLSKSGSIEINNLLAIATLLMGIGFFVIYFGEFRKVGLETQGQPIWWNHLRPIHGVLYFTFSYLIFIQQNYTNAWKILLFDVLFGLFSFLHFHYTSGNFSKLFI